MKLSLEHDLGPIKAKVHQKMDYSFGPLTELRRVKLLAAMGVLAGRVAHPSLVSEAARKNLSVLDLCRLIVETAQRSDEALLKAEGERQMAKIGASALTSLTELERLL